MGYLYLFYINDVRDYRHRSGLLERVSESPVRHDTRRRPQLHDVLRGLGDQSAELQTEAREGLWVGHREGSVQTQLDSTLSRRPVRGVADRGT